MKKEANPTFGYMDKFQKALDEFGVEVGRQKSAFISTRSRVADLRNERERIEAEITLLKDKNKSFTMEISSLQEKIEARKRELKELLNT